MSCLFSSHEKKQVAPKYEVPITVAPGVEPFKFDPPVDMGGVGVASWDTEFLSHKRKLTHLAHTCTSGNEYSFWIDGDDGGKVPLPMESKPNTKDVFCFHDVSMSKSIFINHENTLGGIRLISMDRLGHGDSAPEPERGPMLFDYGVADILEIIDHIVGTESKVYLFGHGTGGVWAMQVAVALKSRCLGVAAIASPLNPFHPQCRQKDRRSLVPKHMINMRKGPKFLPDARKRASSKSCSRILLDASKRVFRDKLKDPGFAQFYKAVMKGNSPDEDGGDERSFAAMDHDQFFVSKVFDAYLNGAHTPYTILNELRRCIEPWHYDPSQIACPLYLYHGANDKRMLMQSGCAQALSRIVGKHARCQLMREHGHISIMLEFRKILQGLTAGRIVDSSFHRSHILKTGISSEALAAASTVHSLLDWHHHDHDVHEYHQVGRDALNLIHHDEEEHKRREAQKNSLDEDKTTGSPSTL